MFGGGQRESRFDDIPTPSRRRRAETTVATPPPRKEIIICMFNIVCTSTINYGAACSSVADTSSDAGLDTPAWRTSMTGEKPVGSGISINPCATP